MSTITFNITADPISAIGEYLVVYDETTLKGNPTVNLNFLDFDESQFKVKSLKIDWGDGSPIETYTPNIYLDYYYDSIIPEVKYNRTASVCLEYNHTYNPASTAYFTRYAISILATYYNTRQGQFVIPLRIAKPSMYDNIGEINILNTQVLPLSTSNTIMNIQTQKDFYVVPIITASS